MRNIGSALQAHLDTGATTLCWCWRLTRDDGQILGFTNHDENLSFDTTIFEASAGFQGTEVSSSLGLSVDNLDVSGALQSAKLDEGDLAAGLFDDAEVEIFIVNWQDVSQRVLIRQGNLGEVRRGTLAFEAEIRGLAHRLNQPFGRLYQYPCDADLGDNRCGVDLDSALLKATGIIIATEDRSRFYVSGLESFDNHWFERGKLTWTSGSNNNRAMEVKIHRQDQSGTLIELWQPMANDIAQNDTFVVTAGCDKQFPTCQQKFDNALSFRGFPHMPGNDFVISYPNRDDGINDGNSRNSNS